MFFAFIFYYFSFCIANQLPREIENEYDGLNGQNEHRINNPNETISIQNTKFSNFIDNNLNGGAVYVQASYNNKKVLHGGNCSIVGCEFLSCHAKNGGAIYAGYSGAYYFAFSISSTTITDCVATEKGGALYLSNNQYLYHSFSILSCTFNSNKAANGGAIHGAVRDQLIINGCNFNNNEATTSGCSLNLILGNTNPKNVEHATFNITDNSFVFTPKEGNSTFNVHVENCKISKNSTVNVEISGCTFSANTPSIDTYYHLHVTEKEGNFESFVFNKCNCISQGIETISIPYSLYPLTNLAFACTSIGQCTPGEPIEAPDDPVKPPEGTSTPPGDQYEEHDRIISPLTENLLLTKCNFTGLKDDSSGGAIYIQGNKTYMYNATIKNCIFNSCSSAIGGAIYAYFSGVVYFKFTIATSEFNECQATQNGGAVYIKNTQYQKHAFSISACTFISNKAANGGGVYGYVRDNLAIKNCNFSNNEATKGSSLWLILGQNNTKLDEYDTYNITGNTFTFAPKAESLNNVYLENIDITNTTQYPPSTYVNIGGNTFSISNEFAEAFNHLEINSVKAGFASINFNKCNCVQQGSSTFSVPDQYPIRNVNFECTAIGSCSTKPEIPPSTTDYPTAGERHNDDGIEIKVEKTEFHKLSSTSGDGGAILMNKNRANISINNCKFTLCEARNGGAIYVQYAGPTSIFVGTIKNTIFSYCSAKTDGGAAYIKITQPKLHSFSFEGCTFESNEAGDQGGAIYAPVRDQFTVEKCKFLDNYAQKEGSSIFLQIGCNAKDDKGNTVTLNENTFTFTPTKDSSNVYAETTTSQNDYMNANLNIGGCTFSTKTQSNVQAFKHLLVVEQMKFESITFTKCNCVRQEEKTFSIPSQHTIENVKFGCTSIDSCTSLPDIPADTSYETKTERYNDTGVVVNFKKVEFYKIASPGSDGGGAIYINSNRVNCNLDHCKFTLCSARYGGAIWIMYAGNGTELAGKVTDTTFLYCTAERDGGAVYLKINQPKIQTFSFEGCTFESNLAGQEGGAIYAIARDQLTIQKCNFTLNSAKTQGSSIWLEIGWKAKNDKGNTVTLNDNIFTFTPTKDTSSNVYIATPDNTDASTYKNANLNIGGCTFSTTTSSDVKGFKHLEIFEKLQFESIKFTKCNCVQQGVETLSVPDVAHPVNNFNFNCDPNGQCVPGTPITLPPPVKPDLDGYISHDRIDDEGQPIDQERYKYTSLKTEKDGGAILINSNKVNCNLYNCTFTSCSGLNGGAIYISYTGNRGKYACVISKTKFTGNTASQNGGALYFKITQSDRHSVSLYDCTFKSNAAGAYGGAIYAEARDFFTIKQCTFEDNNATVGSSIWSQIGWYSLPEDDNTNDFEILACTFKFIPFDGAVNVYVKPYDFALENLTNANLIVSLCKFTTADTNVENFKHLYADGTSGFFKSIQFPHCNLVKQDSNSFSLPKGFSTDGVTFGSESTSDCKPDSENLQIHERLVIKEPTDLKDQKFVYITKEENGGAIVGDKVNFTLTNCKFESCRGGQYGGSVYVHYTGSKDTFACTITGSQFIKCSCKTQGGAIYVQNTQSNRHSVTITNCKFISNSAEDNGGAIYAETRDRFTLKDCEFENNIATNEGYSLWCRIGWESNYHNNVATIENNKFAFAPGDKNPINVYILAYPLLADATPNANLVFGSCTFSSTNKKQTGFKHLTVTNYKSQFESLNFTSCSCIEQGNTTVSLPLLYNPNYYFTFNCEGKCDAKPAEPTPTPVPDAEGYTPALDRINRVEFDPKVVITKVKFNNFVTPSYRYGGAIYSSNIPCSIYDCKFDSCQSTRGGAIYAYYKGTLGNYTCSIVNSLFTNCNSTNGGAIYAYIVQPKRHYITIEGCDFKDNKASENGGALYAEVRDCFSVQYCTFSNNQADLKGSSIWCRIGQDQGNDSGDRASFYGNTITFTPSKTNTINVYIESNKLTEETSPNANFIFGRNALLTTDTNVQGYKQLEINEVGTFESISFTECNCIQGSESSVTITVKTAPDTKNLIYNCQNLNQCPSGDEKPPETNDKCQSYPSRLESFKDEIEREKACFNNLVAPELREGGAVRSINAKVELENCHFTNCSTDSNGGAVYVSFSGSQAELEIKGCTFVSCYSGSKGGAVYYINTNPRCESTFENLRFEENKAANGAGAFYYSPCANSIMKKCFFVNNTCTNKKAQGSSLYVLVANENQNTLSVKPGKLAIKADDEIKPVIIEENRFRSEPAATTQQCYINLKKTGNLQFNTNSFSFNNATDIPKGTQYVYLSKDEGAVFKVEDDICVDSAEQLVGGFDESVKVSTDCHNADASNDDDVTEKDPGDGGKGGKKTNVGMIVGIVVAVVVVIAVVVVVVIFVIRKKSNKYISDLNEEEGAENISNNANTESNL
ncbi:hypothetical protein M9Y10_026192 [Tritrichomonas musculus]|uniref:Right handed beta helix domain-containing protein n=1 Tax=Tritrichomonas musculus TaxID=1915356 RepID=A0ABR2H7S9_9EUKA